MTREIREADPHTTPRSAITGSHWWIVDCEEVGRTAIPGQRLAHQAKEVCRGAGLKVLTVRPANVRDIGDLVAIENSRAELKDAQLRLAVIAGALPGARLNGQKTSAAS